MKGSLKLFGGICFVVLLIALLTVGCAKPAPTPAPAPAPAPAEPQYESFTFINSWNGRIDDPLAMAQHRTIKPFIESLTQGRVTVEDYPEQQLHGWGDALDALESGITDFTLIWGPAVPGKFPLMELFSLPGLAPNSATSDMVVRDLYDLFPDDFYGQFEGVNAEHIASHVFMRADLHMVEPLRSLAELEGKIIACQNDAGARALTELGASTTIMVGSDAYMAAQTGVIDGAFTAWGWVDMYKLHEVMPYHTLISICPGHGWWGINKDTFNKFTPTEQVALKYWGSKQMQDSSRASVWASMNVRATISPDKMIVWSHEDMTKMKQKFEPLWEKWADEMEKLGHPGHAILQEAKARIDAYVYG